MKILRIYLRLPPYRGGMEKHIKRLTEEQVKGGDFVKIYFNAGDKVSVHDERIMPFLPLHAVRPQAIGVLLFYFFLSVRLLFKREDFDIVHIHGDWSSLVFAGIIKKLTRARRIAFSIHDQIGDSVTHRKFLPFLLKKTDLVNSSGLNTARELERLTGKNVIFQPSGVDDAFFSSSERPDGQAFRVITVANLVAKKNINLILDIAAVLKDVTFDIIGDGPDKKRLMDRIAAKSLTNVRLLGSKPYSEVANILRCYDCFLLTSFFEGTPTAMLEAMAGGLPVVSSDVGGLKGVMRNFENGFIISGYSAKDYADHINILRRDADLVKKISFNNREMAEHYRWTNVSRNITSSMKEALSHKPSILHLITTLDIGGAEKMLLELVKGMDKSKFEMKVVSLSGESNQLIPELLKNGIDTEILGMRKNITHFIKAVIRLNKTIRGEKIEIVHAHMFHAMLTAGILKLLNPGIKIVFTSHSFNIGSSLRELTLFLMRPLRDVDIVFSKDMPRYYCKSRHVVIPNAVDSAKYRANPEKFDRFTFISVGRLERVKNHRLLIEAAKELYGRDFQILIAGGGALGEELGRLIKDYGVEDKVKTLGIRGDIPELLSRSHVFVLPSLWEGMPVSLLEAAASGLPVIATPVGSIPEVLNKETGYLSSLAGFKGSMAHVIDHYDEALRKASLLRKRVGEEYSMDRVVEKHESLYMRLAGC